MRIAVQSFYAPLFEEVARLLGITRKVIDERRRAGILLAVHE
jgi:hypothetical protein